MMRPEVTEAERFLSNHVMMFGSDGYPVQKLGSRWAWGTSTVKGPPTTFRTKREAVASFEAWLDIIHDCLAYESYLRASPPEPADWTTFQVMREIFERGT